jgi:K+-transporting ATPase ATPase C chain
MREFLKTLKPAILCFVVMTTLCGVLYPGVVTFVARSLFPEQANGSVIVIKSNDGVYEKAGSALIAQEFTRPEYLIGRPMGTTNLSPFAEEQRKLVQGRVDWFRAIDPGNTAEIPADLATASGSGVDPYISPEAAEYQIPRIAGTRGMSEEAVREIIERYTSGKFLRFWGEPAVHVLKVNLALDGLL